MFSLIGISYGFDVTLACLMKLECTIHVRRKSNYNKRLDTAFEMKPTLDNFFYALQFFVNKYAH